MKNQIKTQIKTHITYCYRIDHFFDKLKEYFKQKQAL